jgi:hypothetical protein
MLLMSEVDVVVAKLMYGDWVLCSICVCSLRRGFLVLGYLARESNLVVVSRQDVQVDV